MIGCRACTPTWFGWSGALQITIQDFRVQEGLRTRGAMSPIPQRPIDECRIAHLQRSDGWIATTRNTMSDPRFVFHYTPTSGSWLNAVETFFSALPGAG